MSTRCARLIAALLLLPAIGSIADDREPQGRSRAARDQRPVKEAIGEVEHNYRGHVVDVRAQRKNESDEEVYRMRVLQQDGRVKTVTVPAKKSHGR
jgi:uncharacterized membrane protein YkoI